MRRIRIWNMVVILAVMCCRAMGGAAVAENPQENQPTMTRGLIHNEDSSHYFISRGPEGMNVASLRAYIDAYANTQLTHLFLNANAMRTSFRSKVWDNIWGSGNPDLDSTSREYTETGKNWARNLFLLDQQGIDPYAVWIARARELGISPWMSMRMNDCHENDNVNSYLHSTFWVEHPEYWRGGEGYYARCLDYGIKQVREYHMGLIREYLERYDPDGLELDWMRDCYCFKPGAEAEGREILTEFMRQVRSLANAQGKARGRPIKIAARVPAIPETAIGLGLDAITWAQEGLVDMLVPTARWATSDFDMPLERWREALGDACERITLAAGMEILVRPYPSATAKRRSLEMLWAFTAAMLDRGADQIYLFNHMRNPHVPLDQYRHIYTTAGSLETVLKEPRRHPVTYHDVNPLDRPVVHPLPVDLADQHVARFTVYTGPVPSSGSVSVRVGLAQVAEVANAKLAARVNGDECRALDDHPERSLFSNPARVIQFEVPLAAMRRGANEIEISLQDGGPQRIVWMEIAITL